MGLAHVNSTTTIVLGTYSINKPLGVGWGARVVLYFVNKTTETVETSAYNSVWYLDTHDVYIASEARGGKGLLFGFIYKGLVGYNTTTVKTFANGTVWLSI